MFILIRLDFLMDSELSDADSNRDGVVEHMMARMLDNIVITDSSSAATSSCETDCDVPEKSMLPSFIWPKLDDDREPNIVSPAETRSLKSKSPTSKQIFPDLKPFNYVHCNCSRRCTQTFQENAMLLLYHEFERSDVDDRRNFIIRQVIPRVTKSKQNQFHFSGKYATESSSNMVPVCSRFFHGCLGLRPRGFVEWTLKNKVGDLGFAKPDERGHQPNPSAISNEQFEHCCGYNLTLLNEPIFNFIYFLQVHRQSCQKSWSLCSKTFQQVLP